MCGTEFHACSITGGHHMYTLIVSLLATSPELTLCCNDLYIVLERFVPVHVVNCTWRSPYCASGIFLECLIPNSQNV